MEQEQEYKYMVCTQCWTFNHAPYIVDAMNGFTMQETTFPVVTVIVDDASTDGEQDVIRQYLNEHFQEPYRTEETDYAYIICAFHRTNPNCQFVLLLLKYNHYSKKKRKQPYLVEWLDNSKYHAICEGDDYWIDPHKLQIQVGFLNKNTDYSLCFHNAFALIEGGIEKNNYFSNIEDRDYSVEEITKKFVIPTASAVFRKEIFQTPVYLRYLTSSKMVTGDWATWLACAHVGKIRGMSAPMSVYRQTSTNFSSTIAINSDYKYKIAQMAYDLYPYCNKEIGEVCQWKVVEYCLGAAHEEMKQKHTIFTSPVLFSMKHFPLYTIKEIIKIFIERKFRR